MGHVEPDALLAEQVDSLFSFAPAAAFGSALGIIVMVMLFHSVAPPEWLWPWGALTLLLWSARAGQALLWHRLPISPQTNVELLRWRLGCYLMTLGSGALWGVSTWLFFDHADPLSQAVLVISIFSFCIAAVPILAHKPPVFYGYLVLAFGPLVLRVAMSGQDRAAVLMGVLLLILGSMMVLGRSMRREFERGVALKQETQALLAQLREEKQAADAARQTAELANKAKTRFFAAASHDLRQPLHAMGLFAEALRGRVGPDPEVQRLAASINSAVDALEGLFSELMDITRIDSGGVQVRPEHVNAAAQAAGDAGREAAARRLKMQGREVRGTPANRVAPSPQRGQRRAAPGGPANPLGGWFAVPREPGAPSMWAGRPGARRSARRLLPA